MNINIINSNILESTADAIILTIDGSATGMGGHVANDFAKLWPDAWEEVEDELEYPLGLGKVVEVNVFSDCPFKQLLVASTLHHMDVLSMNQKLSVVRTATENAIQAAAASDTKVVATTILSGGWRLDPLNAFMAMSDACESQEKKGMKVTLDIYMFDQNQFEAIDNLAKSIGWD